MVRVRVQQGEVEGTTETTKTGFQYSSFKGIPYAAPPIGDLRFKAPQLPKKWEGIHDASKHGPVCPQWDMALQKLVEGNEDCLFINVYTPNLKGNLPVMFFIHGGAFYSGSGDSMLYGPEYLAEEGVVLVTFNYRLEVLGFLCMETAEVPGNAGLKDQVLAMRWVRDNIAQFGGNPNNVTIFGESAGGACVTYHLVSPMSKGLFHKAITQSGCFYNDWTRSYDNVDRAFRLGKYLGTDTKDKDILLKALKKAPAIKFARSGIRTSTEAEKYCSVPFYFTPTVEKTFKGQECFMPESAVERLKKRKFVDVPIIVGYNSMEGLLITRDAVNKADIIHADFRRKLPRDILLTVPAELARILGEYVKEFYFSNKCISDDHIYDVANMQSDSTFVYGIQKFAIELTSKAKSPVFFYRLTADGILNCCKLLDGYSHIKGANHADDLFYMFSSWVELDQSSDDWKAMKQVVRMWTNFARQGNPTPDGDTIARVKWKPMSKNEFNYLEIGFDLTPRLNPDFERVAFWDRIYAMTTKNKSKL